jgi:uncharacterized repeat protein (TIGR03803 family)
MPSTKSFVMLIAGLLAIAAANAPAAAAQYTLKTLYSFCPVEGCADGDGPNSPPLRDQDGNLYVVTAGGGDHGYGAVVELSPKGKKWRQQVLFSFDGTHGAIPYAGVIMDVTGSLYGTTESGGLHGGGVVYKLTPDAEHKKWKVSVLYNFCSEGGATCSDGTFSHAGLTFAGASSGTLYDGISPLYGVTTFGGTGLDGGVAFELKPAGTKWKEKVLHSFCSVNGYTCSDGLTPVGGLLADQHGNLYGTTEYKGDNGGGGTVFRLTPNHRGTKWSLATLYTFCVELNCPDGSGSEAAVTMDSSGNLFGTMPYGGTSNSDCLGYFSFGGCGVAFELSPDQETTLHNFCSDPKCTDGSRSYTSLTIDGSGKLFGATLYGGSGMTAGYGIGSGIIFSLNGTFEVLYSFCSQTDCGDGAFPTGVTPDDAGNLLGTTGSGGKYGHGTIFELTK